MGRALDGAGEVGELLKLCMKDQRVIGVAMVAQPRCPVPNEGSLRSPGGSFWFLNTRGDRRPIGSRARYRVKLPAPRHLMGVQHLVYSVAKGHVGKADDPSDGVRHPPAARPSQATNSVSPTGLRCSGPSSR